MAKSKYIPTLRGEMLQLEELYYETQGAGDCFFHGAFGRKKKGIYRTDNAKEMRQDWQNFLKLFTSLKDPKMPKSLNDFMYSVFEAVLEHPENLGTDQAGLKAISDIRYKQSEAKKALDDLIIDFDNQVQAGKNRDVIFETILTGISTDKSESDLKKIDWLKDIHTDNNAAYQQYKNQLAEVLKDKRYLREKLTDHYILIHHKLYPNGNASHKTADELNEAYNEKYILNNFISTPNFYDFYCADIINPKHYVTSEEIPILSALSQTKIYVFYQDPSDPLRYISFLASPHDDNLGTFIKENYKTYTYQSSPWNKKKEVAIHYKNNHYSRGNKQILNLIKDKDNDEFFIESSLPPKKSKHPTHYKRRPIKPVRGTTHRELMTQLAIIPVRNPPPQLHKTHRASISPTDTSVAPQTKNLKSAIPKITIIGKDGAKNNPPISKLNIPKRDDPDNDYNPDSVIIRNSWFYFIPVQPAPNIEERISNFFKHVCCFWDICGFFTSSEIIRVALPPDDDPELLLKQNQDFHESRLSNITESVGYTSLLVALVVIVIEAVRIMINSFNGKKADDLSSDTSISLHFVIVIIPAIGAFFEKCFKTLQETASSDLAQTNQELQDFEENHGPGGP